MSSALYPRILSGTPDKAGKGAKGRRHAMHYMITQPPPGEAILIIIFDILDKRDRRETRERNTLDDRGVLGDSRGRHLLYTVVDSCTQ